MQFEGHHIRVDLAAGVSKSIRGGGKNVLYDSGKSVFLGNLPFDVTVSQRRPCTLTGCPGAGYSGGWPT